MQRTKGHTSAVPPLFTGHRWPWRSSPRPPSRFRCNGLPVLVYFQNWPQFGRWNSDFFSSFTGRLSVPGVCGGSQPTTAPSLSAPSAPTPPRESKFIKNVRRLYTYWRSESNRMPRSLNQTAAPRPGWAPVSCFPLVAAGRTSGRYRHRRDCRQS